MLNKEIRDTLKTLLQSLITLLIFPMMYGMSFLADFGLKPADYLEIILFITLLIFAVNAGFTAFGSEKKYDAFEYLFSWPLSRIKMFAYKLLPRLGALAVLITLACLFGILDKPIMGSMGTLLVFFIAFFMSFTLTAATYILGPLFLLGLHYIYTIIGRIIYVNFFAPAMGYLDFAYFLSACAMLIPLGISFWISFKNMDARPFSKQLTPYLFIGAPAIAILAVIVIIDKVG